MNLDRQIKVLIDNAPQDGATPKIVEAIAPALKEFASRLKHSQYYVFRTLDEGWVLTNLSNRLQPSVEKNAIYAFATPEDAKRFQQVPDPQTIIFELPVIHILFQMFAMEEVDSTIFMETPGNLATGTEVFREQLQSRIQVYLQIYQQSRTIPPDIA
jgi:hypothetical protein